MIEALYWADTGEESQPRLDAPLSDELRERIGTDVERFIELAQQNPEALAAVEADPAAAGHDLWLTRNHHGAGFWDGDWPYRIGVFLTECCNRIGALEIYEGDDGRIYA